jgi:large subunit ribosomal protein L13
MIIDAKDLILGRMATFVAKQALLGEKIDVINAEEAVITGNRKWIISHHVRKRDRGVPLKGPYMKKMPDMFVKKAIRGMLPYKQEKGRKAYDNIRCHIGVPEKLKDQKAETLASASIEKLPNIKFIKVKELCKLLGAKHG